MRDDHSNPPQSRAQTWVTALLLPVAIAMGVAGAGLVQAGLMPPSVSAPPSSISATDNLNQLLTALATPQAIVVTLPETLMVVTPTPVPLPTRAPSARNAGIDICTDNTPADTVCKQPPPPPPPPTEIPSCPVAAGSNCVSTGKPIEHLPTPTPGPPYKPTVD